MNHIDTLRPWELPESIAQPIHELLAGGLTIREVAKAVNVSQTFIRQFAVSRGLPCRHEHLDAGKAKSAGARKRAGAAMMVNGAVLMGILVPPGVCEQCGIIPVATGGEHRGLIAHHCDYNQPLVVNWLCPTCHRRWHGQHEAKNRL